MAGLAAGPNWVRQLSVSIAIIFRRQRTSDQPGLADRGRVRGRLRLDRAHRLDELGGAAGVQLAYDRQIYANQAHLLYDSGESNILSIDLNACTGCSALSTNTSAPNAGSARPEC